MNISVSRPLSGEHHIKLLKKPGVRPWQIAPRTINYNVIIKKAEARSSAFLSMVADEISSAIIVFAGLKINLQNRDLQKALTKIDKIQ